MGVSFQGHTPNYAVWVFTIDGKRFVARNFSTPEPLNIKFGGTFDDSPLGAGLVKTSGFDITESGPRVVIWTWGGRLYTSSWDLDDSDEKNITLYFSTPIPYSGPPVSPVGNGGVTNTQSPPPASIPAIVPSLPIDTSLISELKDSIDNANKALAVSEAQRKVDIQALNTARIEIENSKQSLAQALSKASADQQGLLAQMQERIDAMQERADIQINIARQMMAQQAQTPPVTPPVTRPPITSPVVTTPTQTPVTAPSGTDWVKLGLQLGAAYLILS